LFPRSLFTLSLQTVTNILDGALQQHNESGTAAAEGTASSDTLLHYLRSLQLDKAADRLRLLAEEAGVNIDNGTAFGLADNVGHIASSYRAGKKKYVEITGYLSELQARCTAATRILEPMPTDYAIAHKALNSPCCLCLSQETNDLLCALVKDPRMCGCFQKAVLSDHFQPLLTSADESRESR
jgi:hypothetical protein